MWLGYMSELLGLSPAPEDISSPPTAIAMPSSAGMHAKLVKADFHGSVMTGRGLC
jgi:ribonuclease P protein subunit POP4